MSSVDAERLRARDSLLERASAALYAVVAACAEKMPMTEIAGFIEGDAAEVHDVFAGDRRDVADVLRERSAELHHLAGMLAKKEPGFLPCVFVVKLANGHTDVSVVALQMHSVN